MFECPICLLTDSEIDSENSIEDATKKKIVIELKPCNHSFHLHCISQTFNLECPMCRTKPTNLPKEVERSINKNGVEFKSGDLDERRVILARLPSRIQASAALFTLQSMGIPLRFLPVHIDINTQNANYNPNTPIVFDTIIYSVMNNLNAAMGDEEILSEDDEDEEDVFENENQELRNINRTLTEN